MSFDALEKLGSGALPYELYLFQTTGISFALTSSEISITYLGEVYAPATVSRTEVEQSNEVVSGQIKIFLPVDHPLSQMLIPYLPSSPIAITYCLNTRVSTAPRPSLSYSKASTASYKPTRAACTTSSSGARRAKTSGPLPSSAAGHIAAAIFSTRPFANTPLAWRD